jgi:hypothetical protein
MSVILFSPLLRGAASGFFASGGFAFSKTNPPLVSLATPLSGGQSQ